MNLLGQLSIRLQWLTVLPARGGGGGGGGGGHGGGSSGGGSGFSGGGSHYNGGGGMLFFGGGSSSVFSPLWVFGISLAVVVFVVLAKNRSRRSSKVNTVADVALSSVPGERLVEPGLSAQMARLKEMDPDFSLALFVAAAERIFYAVEKAWCDRDSGATRRLMSDTIWQNHKQQIDSYIARGAHNKLDGLATQYKFIQSIHLAGTDERIVVRFFVDSTDYDVDDNGKQITLQSGVKSWVEDWTFMRAAGALTKLESGIYTGRCPNCNAPLDVDSLGNCNYCHAAIMGGHHDWVLAQIDQIPSLETGWMSRGAIPAELDPAAL